MMLSTTLFSYGSFGLGMSMARQAHSKFTGEECRILQSSTNRKWVTKKRAGCSSDSKWAGTPWNPVESDWSSVSAADETSSVWRCESRNSRASLEQQQERVILEQEEVEEVVYSERQETELACVSSMFLRNVSLAPGNIS